MGFLEIVTDGVLALLGKVTRHCGKRTQIVMDILVAAVFLLVVDGYAIWRAVHHYRQGELLIAAVFALVVMLSLLLIGFVVIRRIIRKRKNKEQ